MSYLGQEIKQILPGNVAVGGANMGMVPLFAVMWCPNRSAIWAGYAPLDGQELLKALYPDADAGIQAGNVPLAAEATWQSTPAQRGKYVATSSAGKFRLADFNGISAGTLGAVFLRGDGTLSSGTDGVIQLDEFENHDHAINSSAAGVTTRIAYNNQVGGGGDAGGIYSTYTKGGNETRPLNVTGCWVVKLFGSVTNAGSADAGQLATSYADLMAKYNALIARTKAEEYVSAQFTWVAGGLVGNVAGEPHTLSGPHDLAILELECVVADNGYIIGDVIQIVQGYSFQAADGMAIWGNAGGATWNGRWASTRIASGLNKATGAVVNFTSASWRGRVRLIRWSVGA